LPLLKWMTELAKALRGGDSADADDKGSGGNGK
jgi:hypothetical protein